MKLLTLEHYADISLTSNINELVDINSYQFNKLLTFHGLI